MTPRRHDATRPLPRLFRGVIVQGDSIHVRTYACYECFPRSGSCVISAVLVFMQNREADAPCSAPRRGYTAPYGCIFSRCRQPQGTWGSLLSSDRLEKIACIPGFFCVPTSYTLGKGANGHLLGEHLKHGGPVFDVISARPVIASQPDARSGGVQYCERH